MRHIEITGGECDGEGVVMNIRTTTSVDYFCLLSVQKQAYGKYVYIRLIGKKSSFMIVYED